MNGMLAVKEPDPDGDYSVLLHLWRAGARKVFYPQEMALLLGNAGPRRRGLREEHLLPRARWRCRESVRAFARSNGGSDGTAVTLTQETDYPLRRDPLRCAWPAQRPSSLRCSLRVPAWMARSPQCRVNGKPAHFEMRRGFAVVRRRWSQRRHAHARTSNAFRTEAIDDLHPETVALLRGPLVYVELNPAEAQQSCRAPDALRARRARRREHLSSEPVSRTRLYAPFYSVRDETYTMYAERS